MNNKMRWTALIGIIVLITATLLLIPQVRLPLIASFTSVTRSNLSQPARQENYTSTIIYQTGSIATGKESALPQDRQSQSIPPAQLNDVNDPDNPILNGMSVEPAHDTGEFLDPDAKIPQLPLGVKTDPIDTGPFMDADAPVNVSSPNSTIR